MKNIFSDRNLRDENLSALAHHEHREIIFVSVMLLNIFQNCGKSFLVLLIYDCFRAITWKINTVDFIQNLFDFFRGVEI
jgi:hypothetical protein